jgi:hypothetical protein
MNRADVVVATMTRVRSAEEGELILRGLGRVAESGLPIAISDRESPRNFCDRLQRLPGVLIVEPDGNGLVGQIVASVSAALGTGRRFVLYTEPDKEDFFASGLDDFLRRAQWVHETARSQRFRFFNSLRSGRRTSCVRKQSGRRWTISTDRS